MHLIVLLGRLALELYCINHVGVELYEYFVIVIVAKRTVSAQLVNLFKLENICYRKYTLNFT